MRTSNRTWRWQLAALPLALLLLAASATGADPLRWKFKAGDAMDYVVDRNIEGKINFGGAEIEFTFTMTFDTNWQVKAVDKSGTADVEQKVTRLQLAMSSPLGGDLAYDSNKPDDKPDSPLWGQIEPMIEGMIGESVTMKITPMGKVSDITLSKKMSEALGGGPGGRQGFGIGNNGFSEAGVKEMLEKAVLPLPEKAPGKDVTWSQTFKNEIPGIGTQGSETKFSFGAVEKKDGVEVQTINSKTEMTFEPAKDPRAELEISEQEGSGTFFFDAKAGRLVGAKGTQKTAMELSGPQEMTQEMKEVTTMKQGKSPAKKEEKKEAAATK